LDATAERGQVAGFWVPAAVREVTARLAA